MNQLITQKPNVQLKAGHAVTTSLAIAQAFGKEHRNVTRTIQNLECSDEFRRLNFEQVEYTDTGGRKQPMYEVTRDGFIFVGMGFTGAAAGAMKEAYINAFNAMEAKLSEPRAQQVQAYELGLQQATEAIADLNAEVIGLQRFKIAVLESGWKPKRKLAPRGLHVVKGGLL